MDTGTIILVLSFGIPLVVIALILLGLKRSFAKKKKWADELKLKQANAKPATAKGISAPYEADAAWFVETLHFNKIQEGNTIMVKVDGDNPKTIYPAESWTVYTEGYDRSLSLDKLRSG